MANSETEVAGLKELQALLDQLPALVEQKLMRGALRAGQKVIADDAKARVPVAAPSARNTERYGTQMGELRDSIRVSARARNGTVTAKTRVGNRKAFYAAWVEFGTKAHLIAAKPGGALSVGGREYAVIDHPGARMHPFMRPSLDMASNGNSASFQAVAAYLQGRITKELANQPDEVDGPAK